MTTFDKRLGVYGKIPILGDFISRRLPDSFVQGWDLWLQRSMAESKKRLKDKWLDIYLMSPIWHFLLRPGICGASGWVGVMIPSVDRVGRYFPLTLAMAVEKNRAEPTLLIGAHDWFERLADLALYSLQDDFDMVNFDQPIEPPTFTIFDSPIEFCNDGTPTGQTSIRLDLAPSVEMAEGLVRISGTLLSHMFGAYSLWMTSGSERVKPSVRIFAGLPPAQIYTDFISD